ncbi:MAG: radical SAM protein [Bifidobacteriaceae bacterium]|jgi:oxygen-independent coproporphyrinogen-3 oxidase|nr:radical SAM protein [Bifidobacteriaceae bacterium]
MAPPFQIYVHVPFCARRCGYCDFNTYVAGPERRRAFVNHALAELEMAGAELDAAGSLRSVVNNHAPTVLTPGSGMLTSGNAAVGAAPTLASRFIHRLARRPAQSVFFGGGTPTLLSAVELARLVGAVRRIFGIAPGAEVTVEANPDTIGPVYLETLAAAGFTRLSLGMQSAVPRILAALDRSHDPARLPEVVRAAAQAGLDVSVDLIYGTPGESLADWEASLRAALDLGVRHISAYALSLEPHTPMARRIAAGQLAAIDPDQQAEKYELADRLFQGAGLHWYEISNWSRPGCESRHNLGYWTGADWRGIGPGAHSSMAAERWWNVKSPVAYGRALEAGRSPKAGGERLDQAALALERVMLRLRTARGLDLAALSDSGRAAVPDLVAEGLVRVVAPSDRSAAACPGGAEAGEAGFATQASPDVSGGGTPGGVPRLVLTRRGRLLADLVTRQLV